MARRDLLTEEEWTSLFGIPTERAALARYYTLSPPIPHALRHAGVKVRLGRQEIAPLPA